MTDWNPPIASQRLRAICSAASLLLAAVRNQRLTAFNRWGLVLLGICTSFIGGAGVSLAAEPGTNVPAFVVKTWRTSDGLPQNAVLALAQTRDGYLWVGTRGGLARFDGVRFRSYGLADGLKGLNIWSLAEDGQGGLWIGTLGGGLSHWHDGKITTWTTADGLAHNDVMALAAAGPGAVWVGTKRGLQHYGPKGFATVGDAADLRREVVALATDREGGLWLTGEGSGLYYCKAGRCELMPGPPELPKVNSYSLVVDAAGDLWISPGNGFVFRRQRMGAWTVFTQKDGVPYEFIRSLAQGATGEIWGASPNAGLYVFREGRFHAVAGMNSSARSVLLSREGVLWAGTPASGLCRLTPKRLAAYLVGQEDRPVTVTSLVEATPGEFLVATYGNGLFRGSLNRLESVQIEKTLVDRPHLTSVLKMREGVVWVGGAGVLARRAPGAAAFQTISFTHNLVALCEGADGSLWLGSREGELLHLVDDKPQSVARGSMGALVSALISGEGTALWVATQGAGLVRWENGRVQRWTTKEGLPTDVVRALHRDAAGTLWIGTAGGGIAWLEAGRIRVVNSQSGLADDFISQILEDADENLWLGGHHGISRVSKRELRAVASGQVVAVHPLVLDETDGMLSAECTGGTSPAGWRSASGTLHFSTMRGVAVVNPAQFGSAPSPPAVRIEEVKLDGKTIPLSGGRLSLPPGPRELQINYTAFNYAKPEQMRFRYRLAGRDEQWEEVNRARSVRFSQLRSGDYTFQVSAANQDGRWHETGASLAFTVQPFFWQTVWFRIVGALLLIASGGGAVWRLVRARLRRAEFRKAILDSVGAQIAVLDDRGVIVAVNARWLQFALENPTRTSELPSNVGIGANYLEICRPGSGESAESAKAAVDGIQEVLAGRMKSFSLEYACHSPQQQRWFSMNVTPLGRAGQSVVISHVDITNRKQAEESTRNAQELMAAIFNSVPGLLYLYTTEGRLVRWNRQHEELTGYTSEELLNFPIQDWFAKEDQIQLAQEFSKVLSEGSTLVEMNLRLKNGEMVPYSFTGTKVIIDGKPCLVGIGINISERKRVEEANRNAHELMAAVFNSVPGLLYLYAEDGRLVQWNKQHEEMTGFTAEELLKRRARDWYDEEDLSTFDAAIRRIFSEGYAEAEMKLIHKNGERVPYFLTGSKLIIDGKPHLVGIALDISARKKAEELLRTTEARYRDIFEGAIEGIFRSSLQGEIMAANPALAQMLGYDSPEDLIRAVHDTGSQVWADLTERSQFVRLLEERSVVRAYECQFKRRDGTNIWVSLSSRVVRDSTGRVACFEGFIADITERKQAEQELQQQRDELAHLSRVTMLGELSGALAHELNQPLTAILSNAQAAQRFLAHDPPVLAELRDILADIVAEDQRAGEVIRRLRLLLKKSEFRHQSLDLNDVVQEVLKLVRNDLVNRGVTAQMELAPDPPAISGDRVQLQQVVINMVMNACHAMTEAAPADRALVLRTTVSDGEGVRVEITDRGCGIPPEHLERIFAPFFTTRPEGMGMGLAVCRTIISAHGGKMGARNNAERGATFYFTIPAQSEPSL